LLLLGVAFYSFFGRKEEVKVRPAAQITITTETAQKGNIGVFLEAIGTVTPVYTVSIFSQVTGVLLTDLAQLVRGMSRLPEPARYPHTVPYGTAFSGRTFPRHFVPGYDQLSPGQSHSHPA
jgi:hypothetical protein